MATTIRELVARLGVDADDRGLKKFDKGLTSIKRGMTAAVIGAAVLGAALIKIALDTAAAGDEAAKAAQRIGITAEEMQELAFAANLAGAEMSDVEVGFRRLAANAKDTADGTGEAADAFNELGVSVVDSQGKLKGSLVLFEETAEALTKVENKIRRAALAQDIFGRSGSKLLPLLNAGADGIRKMRQEAQALGLVMSEEDTKSAEELVDAITRLKAVVRGFKNVVGTAVIPTLTRAADATKDWFLANKDLIKQKIDKFFERIGKAGDKAVIVIDRISEFVDKIGGSQQVVKIVQGLVAALVGLKVLAILAPLVPLIEGLFAVFAGATLASIGQVVLVIAAMVAQFVLLFLIGQDIVTFFKGGDSALGRFIERFKGSNSVFGDVIELFKSLIDLGTELFDIVFPFLEAAAKNAFSGIKLQFAVLMAILKNFVIPTIRFFIQLFVIGLRNLVANIRFFRKAFESEFGPIQALAEKFSDTIGGIFAMLQGGVEGPGTISLGGGLEQASAAVAPSAGATRSATGGGQAGSISIAGDTITIPIDARGMDEERLTDSLSAMLEERDKRKARQARQRFSGREV